VGPGPAPPGLLPLLAENCYLDIRADGPEHEPGQGQQKDNVVSRRLAQVAAAFEEFCCRVIDVVADDVPDLLRKSDGRTVKVAGKSERLTTEGLEVVTAAPDWRTELLAVITDPNVAFILMLIGVYGLIFEFLNPGAVAPGLVGSISLLVALYALNLLPIN